MTGIIESDKHLSSETFKCELFDTNNNLVRKVSSDIIANKNIDTKRDDLTLYPDGIDDDLKELKEFGFCELLTDKNNTSFNKASIKCYYDDQKFRCLIYSASNIENGSIFDDGLNLLDDEGNYFKVLEKGKYKIVVTILKDGEVIASDTRNIEIGSYSDTLICRVNPLEHKLNMFKWAIENKYAAWVDDLPGYLAPYHNNEWFYHMGLLNFYRANDICLYKEGRVHMFIYQTAFNSTSYETEYAYLQTMGVIDDEERFISYAYDIGETKVKNRIGKIIKLEEDIHLYRIDTVNLNVKENVYDLNENNLIDFKTEDFEYKVNDTIAISGVVKPYQLDKNDFILRKNNTYQINNAPDKLLYEFKCDEEIKTYTKELNMLRFKDKELETSVFEFYNIFKLDDSFKDKTWNLSIRLLDKKGKTDKALDNIKIKVVK